MPTAACSIMLRRRCQVSAAPAVSGLRRASASTSDRLPPEQNSVMMQGGSRQMPKKLTTLGWRREASRPASCIGQEKGGPRASQHWCCPQPATSSRPAVTGGGNHNSGNSSASKTQVCTATIIQSLWQVRGPTAHSTAQHSPAAPPGPDQPRSAPISLLPPSTHIHTLPQPQPQPSSPPPVCPAWVWRGRGPAAHRLL